MNVLQGTTPILRMNFADTGLSVADFDAAELTLKSRAQLVTKYLSDMTADTTNNRLTYHFTEAETLAFPFSSTVTWQLFVRIGTEKYGTKEAQLGVERKTKGAAMDG